MATMKYETSKKLSELNRRDLEDLCDELQNYKKSADLSVFFQDREPVTVYEFDTLVGRLRIRIDIGFAKDRNHPNHPENPGNSHPKAFKLYYLQVQDNGECKTYANVVYPQMRKDVTNPQGYTFSDLIDAIIESLSSHKGCYLYV